MKLFLQVLSIVMIIVFGSKVSGTFVIEDAVSRDFQKLNKQKNLKSRLNTILQKSDGISHYKMKKIDIFEKDKLL